MSYKAIISITALICVAVLLQYLGDIRKRVVLTVTFDHEVLSVNNIPCKQDGYWNVCQLESTLINAGDEIEIVFTGAEAKAMVWRTRALHKPVSLRLKAYKDNK